MNATEMLQTCFIGTLCQGNFKHFFFNEKLGHIKPVASAEHHRNTMSMFS